MPLASWWLVGDSYRGVRFASTAAGQDTVARNRASRTALRLPLAELEGSIRQDPRLAGRADFAPLLNSLSSPPPCFENFAGRVVGLVVLRQAFTLESCLTRLTNQQRQLYIFWNLLMRRETGCSLCFFECNVIPFLNAQPLITQGSRQSVTNMQPEPPPPSRNLQVKSFAAGFPTPTPPQQKQFKASRAGVGVAC